MNRKSISLSALLLTGVAGIAVTGDGKAAAAEPAGSSLSPMLRKFDRDGDGKLSPAELAEAKKAMAAKWGGGSGSSLAGDIRKKMLAEYDRNKDGKLDESERALARKAMFEVRWAKLTDEERKLLLARYDKDGDGKLSDAEKAAVHGASEMPGPANPPSAEAIIKSYDKDGDKKLDAMELTKVLRAMGSAPAAGTGEMTLADRRKILTECDKNHNGRIDFDERGAAQAALSAKQKELDAKAKADPKAASRPALAALARLKEFDVNEDAKLDVRELTAMLARGHGGVGMPGRRPLTVTERIVRQFDKDGDGRLNEAEREALKAAMMSGKVHMGGGKSPKP